MGANPRSRPAETVPPPAPVLRSPFGVKARHRRKLTRFANLLGVDPKRFLRWQMSHAVRELEKHLLTEWAKGLIDYESPEEREAAIARVDAWMSRRKRAERRAA